QELYRYEPMMTPDGEELDQWVSLGIHPHSPKLARFRQALGGSTNVGGFGGGFDTGSGGFGGGFNV
ncbi:hypothetical protein QMN58_32480, partial [Escherichia coli]|nr:hypothetical protein [Escherichia coli]